MDDRPRRPSPFRRLTPDEIELWATVTAGVRPAEGRLRRITPAPAPRPGPRHVIAAVAPASEPKAAPRSPPADLDRRTRAKLQRGKLGIDARLDLHGLGQAEAHRTLIEFLRRAQASGARLSLVVTGKGARSGNERGGVLRRMTPLWLQSPGIRELVAGFGEASREHGGEGALYVQIRRPRGRSSQ